MPLWRLEVSPVVIAQHPLNLNQSIKSLLYCSQCLIHVMYFSQDFSIKRMVTYLQSYYQILQLLSLFYPQMSPIAFFLNEIWILSFEKVTYVIQNFRSFT